MRVFNSLSRKIEGFTPLDGRKAVMYVCGLTPYDSAHIGHARTYVSFDVIKRCMVKKGLQVFHIQNITDVDDKIIRRCRETGADPARLTSEIHAEALQLLGSMNVLPADVYPAVTGHIPDIISLITQLLERGHAYENDSGVYFSIASFAPYGALSGQNLGEIRAGARIEVDEAKKDPADFALWKKTSGELLEFDSPWGKGRPGWHIECSAMSQRYAGRTLDIHGGARDLIFPHHENEIAQSEAASGKKYCNYWLHTGFLTVNGEKMSKSLGNFITLKQALSKSTPNALRLFYLQAHYRSPLDYDEDKLQAMEESVERIFNSLGLIREIEEKGDSHEDAAFRAKGDELIAAFHSHMDDDFNTPDAIAALFSLLRLANSHMSSGKHDRRQLKKIEKELEGMLWVLGLVEPRPGLEGRKDAILAFLRELSPSESPRSAEDALDALVRIREGARKAKDYKKSDAIRARLKELGVVLEDKPGGIRWKVS
ncbi:MAG: cysteine--tRNA ligase [Candidatus ainarchaeum sp.]|nr:cysteine--tRNA ligase [Candidatus ainarchaeum sp.]